MSICVSTHAFSHFWLLENFLNLRVSLFLTNLMTLWLQSRKNVPKLSSKLTSGKG